MGSPDADAMLARAVAPTFDDAEPRPSYEIEVRDRCGLVERRTIPDPFHTTVVGPQGIGGRLRTAWWALRGGVLYTVSVSADPVTVEATLLLDPQYLGVPGSVRRCAWDAKANETLAGTEWGVRLDVPGPAVEP